MCHHDLRGLHIHDDLLGVLDARDKRPIHHLLCRNRQTAQPFPHGLDPTLDPFGPLLWGDQRVRVRPRLGQQVHQHGDQGLHRDASELKTRLLGLLLLLLASELPGLRLSPNYDARCCYFVLKCKVAKGLPNPRARRSQLSRDHAVRCLWQQVVFAVVVGHKQHESVFGAREGDGADGQVVGREQRHALKVRDVAVRNCILQQSSNLGWCQVADLHKLSLRFRLRTCLVLLDPRLTKRKGRPLGVSR
mmetsp:Transcript_81315/g.263770  ORF Transcript_81315/g.263770 Transcript_81315/m.263770 type:complete len:247 (+) Transcript_81315:597-1337(+)